MTQTTARQISCWEYEYETEWTRRIDTVFGDGHYFPWIDAAWAAMLMRQGIIPERSVPVVAALTRDHLARPEPGDRVFGGLEALVVRQHGHAVGGNLTIGRTIPPLAQMAAVRHQLLKTLCPILDVMDALLDVAADHLETVMPGYTHIRHAQPTTFGHYLLSVFDPMHRTLVAIESGYHLMSLNEIGCGALAGTSLPIDRDLVSGYLGLDGLIENANDAVSYTDGYVMLVAALTNLHSVFSRFTLDLNIWSSEEYAFLDVPWVRMLTAADGNPQLQGHTHSHFMPNKTNNCPTLERSRVAAAALAGALTEVSVMGMRCPHADMHEMLHMADPTLRAIRTTHLFMHPYIHVLPRMTINRPRMLEAVRSGWSAATELGNVMVLKYGLDYRTAHDILNEFINTSKVAGVPASRAEIAMFERAAEQVTGTRLDMGQEELRLSLDPEHFIRVTGSRGGVAPLEASRMLQARRTLMLSARTRQEERIARLEAARASLIDALAQTAARGRASTGPA